MAIVLAKVKHVFRHLKIRFGYARVRYREAGEQFESLRVPDGAVERAHGRRVRAPSGARCALNRKKPGKPARIKGE